MKEPDTLTEARNADFRQKCVLLFERDMRQGIVRPLDDVIESALALQPLSHYVNFDLARRHMVEIRRYGISAVFREDNARRQWSEIWMQVQSFLATHPRKSLDDALSFVLNFCRPSRFYISYDTGRRILRPAITYRLTRC